MLREPGNINPINRPVINNPDGSISTTLSFSVNLNGREVLLPMIIGGFKLLESEAIEHYKTTGEHFGIFDTPQEADRYAERLHDFQMMVLREQGLLS